MSTIHAMRPRTSVVRLIHGIMSGRTWDGWPARGVRWAAEHRPDVVVLPTRYYAGPLPRLTHLIVNPRQRRRIVREHLAFHEDLPIDIGAHSNGAVIALGVCERLLRAGRDVRSVTLIAAACPAQVERLARRYPLTFGAAGPCIEAWCSPRDRVTRPWPWPLRWIRWPWGNLGGSGFEPAHGRNWRTVWRPHHNHTSWWDAEHWPRTMEALFDRFGRF